MFSASTHSQSYCHIYFRCSCASPDYNIPSNVLRAGLMDQCTLQHLVWRVHVALYVWACVHPARSEPLCFFSFCYNNIIKPVGLSHLQTLVRASSGVVGAGSMLQRETESNRYEKQSWKNADITEEPCSSSGSA